VAICVFCGRDRTLSAEHVLPDWLLTEFPPLEPSAKASRRLGYWDASGAWQDKSRVQGTVSVPTTVTVVCKDEYKGDDGCNTGWMSRLEGLAKPLITALGHDQQQTLSRDDQRLIAFWATKTMMMVEYTDHTTRATSNEQRRYLYEHRESRLSPPATTVLIGKLDPQSEPPHGWYHRGMGASFGLDAAVNRPPYANMQQTTFFIGHLVLAVFSIAVPGRQLVIPDAFVRDNKMRKILPTSKPFIWPVGTAFDEKTLQLFASAIYLIGESPGIGRAGLEPQRRPRDG